MQNKLLFSERFDAKQVTIHLGVSCKNRLLFVQRFMQNKLLFSEGFDAIQATFR